MAELLILQFPSGVGETEYWAVNDQLGIDMRSGQGDWPPGLQTHLAGPADDGSFVVTEVWASRDDQAKFMESRLGAALHAGGVTSAPTVTWASVVGHQTPNA